MTSVTPPSCPAATSLASTQSCATLVSHLLVLTYFPHHMRCRDHMCELMLILVDCTEHRITMQQSHALQHSSTRA